MANQDFLKTIAKYPTFLAGALLGIFFAAFGWAKPLFRKRLSGALAILFLVGFVAFVVLTVRAMLMLD
ncbi:MAG: DUF751 family protein [Aphanocapsa lilacina HA4352-LM1]|jgi:hypothetical protein|uniref:Ycf33 protein n=2 Tax=Gloeobacter TaxID=33071 RepID=Q7NE49_GLOVI|nr:MULTISPECIES: DUF751 family protein [Gloeobacter]MBW4699723.1 DUF751 family protein [Aphanocapsa lilacina HA4352-LM1]UFP95125.1 DUF751 family protein [Gloeobacter morelensis MG652769]BAC91972.1 ycf33 [Gloeobacter violaceus PCC 7421]